MPRKLQGLWTDLKIVLVFLVVCPIIIVLYLIARTLEYLWQAFKYTWELWEALELHIYYKWRER